MSLEAAFESRLFVVCKTVREFGVTAFPPVEPLLAQERWREGMFCRSAGTRERDSGAGLRPHSGALCDKETGRQQRYSYGRRSRVGVEFGRSRRTLFENAREDGRRPERRISLV